MKRPYLSRKENIVICAIEIIDELGINELTARELAKRQGVTEGALYRHFKSKDDIIHAVLDFILKFDNGIKNTIKENNLGPVEGVLFFVKSFIEYYENYPAITSALNDLSIFRQDTSIKIKTDSILSDRLSFIVKMIKRGQACGEIRSDIDCQELSIMITGFVSSTVQIWRMNNYCFQLKPKILPAIEKVLKTH